LSGRGLREFTPHWLKMTPTLVTENFCLRGRKGGEKEGEGKREGRGGEGPPLLFGQIEPWVYILFYAI